MVSSGGLGDGGGGCCPPEEGLNPSLFPSPHASVCVVTDRGGESKERRVGGIQEAEAGAKKG